jgi:hypothetical protein
MHGLLSTHSWAGEVYAISGIGLKIDIFNPVPRSLVYRLPAKDIAMRIDFIAQDVQLPFGRRQRGLERVLDT